MYTRADYIKNITEDLSNYIEGDDIYNSSLLQYINDSSIKKESYTISLYEYRPDLIARDFYGSEEYMSYIILQTGLNISKFTKGTTIYLISKSDLDSIIHSII